MKFIGFKSGEILSGFIVTISRSGRDQGDKYSANYLFKIEVSQKVDKNQLFHIYNSVRAGWEYKNK